MPGGYDSHADYMNWVREDTELRQADVSEALRTAFSSFIEIQDVEVINFSLITALELAYAIQNFPIILKPLIAACNVAARAIERDLDIRNVNTYQPRLSNDQAATIAGYLKPFLPQELAVPALTELDRHLFADKQIRMIKGQWEKRILEAVNAQATTKFKKRLFQCKDDSFELDAATPEVGDIEVGVDVKRIEARRDIHKRCDEIVNKAAKFKSVYPDSTFVAVVYYPFTAEHINVKQRLESPNIDYVAFASQSAEQLSNVIKLMLGKIGRRRN